MDDRPDYESQLERTCSMIDQDLDYLLDLNREFPSIQFGLEMAFRSLESHDPMILFPSQWTRGEQSIPINGLVWMGDSGFMQTQIEDLLEKGFDCIKLKIGAIDFRQECGLLENIRKHFGPERVELRVDANGAFAPHEALNKLETLAGFELHSIEQPIKAGQWKEMARLCERTPLPIALDEELIGLFDTETRTEMLDSIRPQFLVLKPSLIGGMAASDHWIDQAEERGIGWWITSALESNVGLNAIAQYTFTKQNPMKQGLGTGSLYTNNLAAPLEVEGGFLHYRPGEEWNFNPIDKLWNNPQKTT